MKVFRRSKLGVASGDAIPMFHNGQYHIFFLTSPEGSTVYPDRICTTWRHVVSTNLVDWEELPVALMPGGDGTTIDKDGCWTGSVLFGEGKFHIYYTAANLDSENPQTIAHATSNDGIHWNKDGDKACITPIAEYYELIDWRDPYVFFNEDENCYWMLIAGRKNTGPDTRRACVVLYKSSDLENWEHYGPIYEPGYTNVTECPEMFKFNGYWYLTHSRFSEAAQTVYRVSTSPYGPWRVPKYDGVGGRRFYAAKSMANDQNRRFYFGWVHERAKPNDCAHWCWGGDFCIPHEMTQDEDGELYFKMPEEIEKTFTESISWQFQTRANDIVQNDKVITADTVGKFAYGFFDVKEQKFLFKCQLIPIDCNDTFGILLKSSDDLAHCYLLAFEPGMQRVSLIKYPVPMDPYWADASVAVKDFSIIEPDGPRICEKHLDFKNGDTIDVKVVIENEIMEIFVDSKVAFSFRCYKVPDHEIGIIVQDGILDMRNTFFLK